MTTAEMMPCDQVIPKLWEYLDGELSEENAARVHAHLDVCSRCFPQYEFQQAYRVFMRRGAHESMPPELRRRIFERILEEESGRPFENGARPGIFERVRAAIGRALRKRR